MTPASAIASIIMDNALYKNMFVAEDGMATYMAGIMKALQNGYTLQKYTNKLAFMRNGS